MATLLLTAFHVALGTTRSLEPHHAALVTQARGHLFMRRHHHQNAISATLGHGPMQVLMRHRYVQNVAQAHIRQ